MRMHCVILFVLFASCDRGGTGVPSDEAPATKEVSALTEQVLPSEFDDVLVRTGSLDELHINDTQKENLLSEIRVALSEDRGVSGRPPGVAGDWIITCYSRGVEVARFEVIGRSATYEPGKNLTRSFMYWLSVDDEFRSMVAKQGLRM